MKSLENTIRELTQKTLDKKDQGPEVLQEAVVTSSEKNHANHSDFHDQRAAYHQHEIEKMDKRTVNQANPEKYYFHSRAHKAHKELAQLYRHNKE